MFGLNWVDFFIMLFLAAVLAKGLRTGILSQLFFIAGFFVSLLVCGWVFPCVIRFHDPTIRTTVNASLVLLASLYAAMRGFDLGQKVHWSFRLGKLRKNRNFETAETALGALPSLVAGIIFVWLVGVAIGRLPFVGLSNSVNDARIVQGLTNILPPVPAVFAQFNRHINPNAPPVIALQPKPQAAFNYDPRAVQSADAKARASIVRITSFSCGGIVAGSGFVVAPGLIATDAHVIAGSKRPIIKYNGESYEGTPVYFDAMLDLAILKAQTLKTSPLHLAPKNIARNTTVATLGYPGGNYQASPGIVRDTRAITGANIYSLGNFSKGVYLVQTHVEYGNSGGPIVVQDGTVAGIVFSKATGVDDTAYALTSVHIIDALRHAQKSHTRVSTGACMVQ